MSNMKLENGLYYDAKITEWDDVSEYILVKRIGNYVELRYLDGMVNEDYFNIYGKLKTEQVMQYTIQEVPYEIFETLNITIYGPHYFE